MMETFRQPVPRAKFQIAAAHILASDFGRTDFLQISISEPPALFRGFCRRIFAGKSAQKNPPGKSSKIYTTKIPIHVSVEGPGQHIFMMGEGDDWEKAQAGVSQANLSGRFVVHSLCRMITDPNPDFLFLDYVEFLAFSFSKEFLPLQN